MPSNKNDVKRHLKELGPVVNDPAFADALGDLADYEAAGSPELDKAMQDPQAYFQERQVHLPPNATVKMEKNSPLRVTICVNHFCVYFNL